jgi:GTP-binding protein
MRFVDEATIHVRSGRGGKGCISFLRERFRPRGGPDGGDGGNGGDVILRASAEVESLLDFSFRSHFQALNGGHGRGKKMHGRAAPDLILDVPLGTLVKDASSNEILGDLVEDRQTLVAAHGGQGGKGNARFATATRQAPRFATSPGEGEERRLRLELKILAEVGLVGFPNSGKSTLLSKLSAARPKIASYPFTTLTPQLGVMEYADGDRITIADIPGLVEGAHHGVGLGDRFLRHVERTKLLLHVLDLDPITGRDPLRDFEVLREELEQFDPSLTERPFLVCLNKIDLVEAGSKVPTLKKKLERRGFSVFPISALTGEGLERLQKELIFCLREKGMEE